MKNKMQELISELEAKTDRNELDDKLLEMLLQKQEELGADPSDEEVDAAVRQVIKDHLMFALHQKFMGGKHSVDEDDDPENDDITEDLDTKISLVREVFNDMELHFRDYRHQKGVHAFELGIREKGKQLRMKVYLESDPKVCRIDAVYPFTADREFASCKMPGWVNHKLKSRLLGKISTTSDMQMIPL